MDDVYSFYDSILNIGNKNNKDLIIKIVKEEKNRLLRETNDLSGFCKYIASQIQEVLNINNIKSDLIDLNELLGVDHVILVSEYKEKNQINRVLIDPTFEQFTKSNNKQLLTLEQWPS